MKVKLSIYRPEQAMSQSAHESDKIVTLGSGPRNILRPEALRHCKISMTFSGIELATFWLVAQ